MCHPESAGSFFAKVDNPNAVATVGAGVTVTVITFTLCSSYVLITE